MDWLQYLRRAVSPEVTADEEVVVFGVDYLYDMMNIVKQTDRRSVPLCLSNCSKPRKL